MFRVTLTTPQSLTEELLSIKVWHWTVPHTSYWYSYWCSVEWMTSFSSLLALIHYNLPFKNYLSQQKLITLILQSISLSGCSFLGWHFWLQPFNMLKHFRWLGTIFWKLLLYRRFLKAKKLHPPAFYYKNKTVHLKKFMTQNKALTQMWGLVIHMTISFT